MARISMKEYYDNKDVATQIYDLKDETAELVGATSKAQATADSAIAKADDAVATANDAKMTAEAFDARITNAQNDATLALGQAEDAQTDADKGIVEVSIDANEASGTLYTKTNANVEVRKNIPLASATQTGLMNAQTYQGIVNLGVRVSALEAKKSTAYVVFTSPTPDQAEITQKFTDAVGRAPIAGDQVTDIAKGLTYEYDGSTWIQTTAPVANWTNETAGIIKGTNAGGAPGTLFAEEDGTGSVNGWDELVLSVQQNAKAFSGYSFTEMADRIQVQFNAVDGVTTVSEEIPAATDEKAGVLSAADWSKFNGKNDKLTAVTVTLSTDNWVDSQQIVNAINVTTDNIVWVSPAPSSFDDYGKAGIRAVTQGDGTITFAYSKAPGNDIVVEVVA